MHSFMWNGKSSLDYGIMIEKDPDKNRPAKKYSVSNIQGRNGNYYQNQGTFEEVTRKYNIFCSLSNSGKIDIRDRNINVNKNNLAFTSMLVDIDNNARMGANAYANIEIIAEDGSEISKTITYPNSVFEDLEGGVPKGTFDFVSGTLTATHLYVSFEDLTFSRSGNSHHYRAGLTPYFDVSTEPFGNSWADATTPYAYRGYNKPDEAINKTYSISAYGSTVAIDVYDEDIEDPSELTSTTYSVIVPLSAPRTYQCNTVDIELSAGKYRITGDNPLSITTEVTPQNELITEIMEWLYEPDGYAELSDTYDPDHYREAVLVDAVSVRDLFQTYGRAEVTFRCRPERFLVSNNIDLLSLDLVDVLHITVDTWTWLYREPIESTAYVIDKLYPSDRFVILDTSGTLYKIITLDGGKTGWVDNAVTASEQMYKLVNPTKHIAKPIIHIGVNVYHAHNKADITINTIKLDMQYRNGGIDPSYHDLVIDCEQENVYGFLYTSDSISFNNSVIMTNVDGTSTSRFLYLQSGNNYLASDVWGDIPVEWITVSIEPRFWEI